MDNSPSTQNPERQEQPQPVAPEQEQSTAEQPSTEAPPMEEKTREEPTEAPVFKVDIPSQPIISKEESVPERQQLEVVSPGDVEGRDLFTVRSAAELTDRVFGLEKQT